MNLGGSEGAGGGGASPVFRGVSARKGKGMRKRREGKGKIFEFPSGEQTKDVMVVMILGA